MIWFLRSVISSWQTTTEEAARGSAVLAIVVPPPSFARDMEGLLADADTHGDITVKILKRDQPGDPSHCTWGVERRGEISPLGSLAGCFLALGSGLRLVRTASSRR